MSGPENAVLDDKLSRFDERIRQEEGFIFVAFHLVGEEGTRESFDVVELQIDYQVVHLLEGAHNPRH